MKLLFLLQVFIENGFRTGHNYSPKHCTLTLFTMDIFGAAQGWCVGGGDGQKGPPLLKSVTRTLLWWNLAELYLRRTKKYMNHVTHSLCSANISIFSLEISKSCYIKKYRYTLNFDAQFFSSNLFRVYKGFLIDMGIILMMSAKMTTLAFLKIKMFWNQGYDVIVPVHDVNNIILSRDSNYIVDIILLSCDQS